MKMTNKLFLLIALVSMSLVSCNKIKEALVVEFDAVFKTDLNALVGPGTLKATDGTFNVSSTIDPLSNPDMATYSELIQEINITEITGEITSITQPTTLETATFTMSSAGYSDASWSFSDVALNQGTTLTLDNANGQFDNMQTILESGNEFTVELNGTTTDDDLEFTMEITITTTVKASPL